MKVDPLMRVRGAAKVVVVAMLANEVLTVVFATIARRIDPDVSVQMIQMFSFVIAMLAGFWFQADARRAFHEAQKGGYVVLRRVPEPDILIRENCPKRWMVQLYVELNPSMIRG
ncbi:hypothetical protein AB1286_30320 [Trinickia sp. NRRL B-1857]|uniref:hypothetical protein n=1 Tax=Trinickia sp. NRRL B-1857 TaxID=3162879 RepID=UPI003D2A0CE5